MLSLQTWLKLQTNNIFLQLDVSLLVNCDVSKTKLENLRKFGYSLFVDSNAVLRSSYKNDCLFSESYLCRIRLRKTVSRYKINARTGASMKRCSWNLLLRNFFDVWYRIWKSHYFWENLKLTIVTNTPEFIIGIRSTLKQPWFNIFKYVENNCFLSFRGTDLEYYSIFPKIRPN